MPRAMPRSAKTKPQKPAAEQPLGRRDWIEAAIVMLAEDNAEALRVDNLAERLGVTKGSFYWHFKGREDLLSAVVDAWRVLMTSETRALIMDTSGTPWERLERLIRVSTSRRPNVPGGPFEMTLRDLARRDAKVAEVVRGVDKERTDFLRQLYREAGLSDADADDYAELQIAFVIGTRMTLPPNDRTEAERRRRIACTLLLPRERATRDR
jgi:AcrR family transcriptional regulator